MAALHSRCGHYIFAMWFLLLISFSPRLMSAVADWMSTIPPHIYDLSVNLECMSEMCSTRLAENTGRKKSPKNRYLGTVAQFAGLYLRN